MSTAENSLDTRQAMVLIVCDSRTMDSGMNSSERDSIYLLPMVKDNIRRYALNHNFSLEVEILIELRDDTTIAECAETILSKIADCSSQELLIGNSQLLNESGLSAILLPAMAQRGIKFEAVT